jgi:hypothetical protein
MLLHLLDVAIDFGDQDKKMPDRISNRKIAHKHVDTSSTDVCEDVGDLGNEDF